MFDMDLDTNAEILAARNTLATIEKQGNMVRQQEEKEWRKFYDLVQSMHWSGCDNNKVTVVDKTLGWVEYQTDRFIVLYNADNVLIYEKIPKLGSSWKIFSKRQLPIEKLAVKRVVYLDGGYSTGMAIREINYGHIAEYEQLFKEMTVYYIEFLKNKTHTLQTEIEFRKLAHFA
jgi:hypothetical protein